MGTGDPFPGGKARPVRDADHSPPSSVEVVNEYKLYLLSPQAHPWLIARILYFTLTINVPFRSEKIIGFSVIMQLLLRDEDIN
jgi:hypothetical protein